MQRIPALDSSSASGDVRATLDAIKSKLGIVPKMFMTMSRAPSVLKAYVNFSGAAGEGQLSNKLREQIALVTAQTNGCDYCASAHQALGKMAGLKPEEIACSYRGESDDPKAQAALSFAKAILAKRGKVSDAELAAVKLSGFSEPEVLEIVANVVLNIFTNYFNNVADTEVDFPRVSTADAAA